MANRLVGYLFYEGSSNRLLWVVAIILLAILTAAPAKASDTNYLMLGPAIAEIFDNNQVLYHIAEFRHYLKDRRRGLLTSLEVSEGSYYIAFGGFRERRLFADLYGGASLSPGVVSGDGREKMGCLLEFRTSFELFYRVADNQRLGISISHYSNSGLGDTNPGTESLRLMLSILIP